VSRVERTSENWFSLYFNTALYIEDLIRDLPITGLFTVRFCRAGSSATAGTCTDV